MQCTPYMTLFQYQYCAELSVLRFMVMEELQAPIILFWEGLYTGCFKVQCGGGGGGGGGCLYTPGVKALDDTTF